MLFAYSQMLKLLLPGHVFSFLLPFLHSLEDFEHDGGWVDQRLGLLLLLQSSMLHCQWTLVVSLRLPRGLKFTRIIVI